MEKFNVKKINLGFKSIFKKSSRDVANIDQIFKTKSLRLNISLSQKAKNSSSYLQYWLKTFRAGLTLLCVICLFVFPLLTQNTYYLSIFITPMIFTIFAASWDFLAGFAGQVSFGQSIFFGISAYITSYFLKYLQFNWGFSLIIGALVGVAVGLIVGIPSLRLKGPYLALATLMFSLILFQLFMMEQLTPFLGGTQGIPNVRPLSDNIVEVYFIYLIIMIICVLVMIWIGKSNFGTILKSIRDDDKGARASGINIAKYKIYAFMISGFFAGIAGGLFAMQNRGAGPSIFLPNYSFYAIVFAALGGIGTISGAGLGAFFFWLLYAFFQLFFPVLQLLFPILQNVPLTNLTFFLLAIFLILVIRFAEEGLMKPAFKGLKSLWDLLMGK